MQKNIQLTGDPFVNTGLAVISYLSNHKSMDNLSLEDMRKIYGDGKELARINTMSSCAFSLFPNSLLTHSTRRKDMAQLTKVYNQMTDALIDNIGKESVNYFCEVCGNNKSLDIDKLPRPPSNSKKRSNEYEQERYFGRDWFPLLGSMQKDAQALPGASRPFYVCATCLFAVQYLPQAVFSVFTNGESRLAIYQCTSIPFWYQLVTDVVRKTQQKIAVPVDGKILTEGQGEGYSTVIRRIVLAMNALAIEKRESDLHPDTIIELIRFTNFGSEADSNIEIIPSSALNFIRKALTYNLGEEILQLINNEQPRKAIKGQNKKKPGFHPRNMLINRLLRYEDYRPLYPKTIMIEKRNEKGKIEKHPKDLPGASSNLFSLYQSMILGVSTKSLNTAWRIVDYIHKNTNAEDLEYVRKDTESDRDKQAMIKKFLVKMVEEGKVSFNDYAELFLTIDRVPRINYHAWAILHYYLHNIDRKPVLDIETKTQLRDDNRLIYTASMIFNRILSDKHYDRDWFKKNILDGFATKEVDIEWLRKQFVKSTRINEGFDYNDWKALCLDDEGKERFYDLLFNLRLIWTEFFTRNVGHYSVPEQISIKLDTDLSPETENMIKAITEKYCTKYGPEKFQKEILHKLIVNWRESLYWFKRKMRFDDEQWNAFLQDSDGNDIMNLRRFQLQLVLNNEFRNTCYRMDF